MGQILNNFNKYFNQFLNTYFYYNNIHNQYIYFLKYNTLQNILYIIDFYNPKFYIKKEYEINHDIH
jgi:hypothetical protein